MSNNTVENVCSTITIQHSMTVNGKELMEEKKTTTITASGSKKKLEEVKSHLRKIGEKSITTILENGVKKEETKMSAEEKEKFNHEWKKYWQPSKIEEATKKPVDFTEEN
jgi:hypothetical protein